MSVDLLDRDAGDRSQRAREIIRHVARELDCVLTLQTLCEFVAATTRKKKLTFDQASAQIADWQILFPVVRATTQNLSQAIEAAKDHNLSFWDAMLWATNRAAEAAGLLVRDTEEPVQPEKS